MPETINEKTPFDNYFPAAVALRGVTEPENTETVPFGQMKRLESRLKRSAIEIRNLNQEIERLKSLNRKMAIQTIRAMENERKAMSMDIHDGVSGRLTAIKMLMESGIGRPSGDLPGEEAPTKRIIKHLAETIDISRQISRQMGSLVLQDIGLGAAISENIRNFRDFYPEISVAFQCDISGGGVSDDVKMVVYRVVQEALNNIGKHSGADVVEIDLGVYRGSIRLKITDNGRGFENERMQGQGSSATGFGLNGMKDRVEICKGTFQVTSRIGKGTSVLVAMPGKGC